MRSWPRISAAAADHGAALKDKDNSGLISPPAKPEKECCLEIWRVRGLGSRTREHPSGETDPVYNHVANLYTFFFLSPSLSLPLSLPLSLEMCVRAETEPPTGFFSSLFFFFLLFLSILSIIYILEEHPHTLLARGNVGRRECLLRLPSEREIKACISC